MPTVEFNHHFLPFLKFTIPRYFLLKLHKWSFLFDLISGRITRTSKYAQHPFSPR